MNHEIRPPTSQEADRMRLIARLWTQAQPVVSALISSTVIDFHDAEDLLGQVAETVVTKACEYDPQRPFVPWAMGIARYRILQYFEQRRAGRCVGFDDETLGVLAEAHGTAGHVDLAGGRAHTGDTVIRIRAVGNPMWPLVEQDVKTGPIDGRVVAVSVWAMQPSDDPMVPRQNAIVKTLFLDAAGREFASAERHFLRAEAPKNHWVRGQITALAPPGTVAMRFQVLLNARGQKSGTLLVDDAILSITKPQEPGESETK